MVVAYSVYIGTLDSSELSVGRCFASRTLPPYISIYYPLELQDKLDIQGCVTLLQAHFAAWIIRIGIVFKFLCSIFNLSPQFMPSSTVYLLFLSRQAAAKLRTRVMAISDWTAVQLDAQPMLSKRRPARLVPRKLPMANAAVQREETRE